MRALYSTYMLVCLCTYINQLLSRFVFMYMARSVVFQSYTIIYSLCVRAIVHTCVHRLAYTQGEQIVGIYLH